MASVQAPPTFRQQFRAPSLGYPLSPQTTVPPVWLHWLVAVQLAPGAKVLPLGAPRQTPLTQSKPPQQFAALTQVPPSFRQQFSDPSVPTPLSAQTTAPPV